MNKHDKEFSEDINKKLSQVSENEALPEILSKENIKSIIENEEQSSTRKISPHRKKVTALATSAAVIVLAVCGVLGYKASKNPAAVVPAPTPAETTSSVYGDAPLYDVQSYSALEEKFLNLAATAAAETKNSVSSSSGSTATTSAAESSGTSSPDTAAGSTVSHGKTNIQVPGVDEADTMKNDGKYLYTVADEPLVSTDTVTNCIKIIDTADPSAIKVVSTVKPTAAQGTVTIDSLYVNGNRMIVICRLIESEDSNASTLTIVYDITDRGSPAETGRFIQNGDVISSRLIGNRVYILSDYYVNLYQDTSAIKSDCIPMTTKNGSLDRIDAVDICCMKDSTQPEYLVVCSVNFVGTSLDATAKAVLGGGNNAYCTADTMYVSNSVYSSAEQVSSTSESAAENTSTVVSSDMGRTEIFSFLLNEGKVEFKAYGAVSGVILNQFSMDEYNNYFRIATSVGWNGYSIVTVLDSNLNTVGELTKIAEGESIYAVRFIKDTAYVVTYKTTDPLFVIDLSVPTAPVISGSIELPGFSSYLHPISEQYILGIGKDDTTGHTKLSVFDVSNPSSPKEVSKLVLDGTSVAENDFKAFMTIDDGVYAIPLYIDKQNKTTNQIFSFSVSLNGRLKTVKKYTSDYSNMEYTANNDQSELYSNYIGRTTFTGTTIFAVGQYYVEAYSTETGKKLSDAMICDYTKMADISSSPALNPDLYATAETSTAKAS